MSVMGYLRNFAEATQQTVIATIHQPRSAIWEMFDTVSLLSSGRLMYHGPCSEMLPWFQNMGFSYNKGSESDWVLDLVATGFDKPDHLFGNTLRSAADVGAAADAFKEHYVKVSPSPPQAAAAWHLTTGPVLADRLPRVPVCIMCLPAGQKCSMCSCAVLTCLCLAVLVPTLLQAHGCQPRALTDSCRSNSSRLSELRTQSNSSPKSFTSLVASGVAGEGQQQLGG